MQRFHLLWPPLLFPSALLVRLLLATVARYDDFVLYRIMP
jgi:hypothetical protein